MLALGGGDCCRHQPHNPPIMCDEKRRNSVRSPGGRQTTRMPPATPELGRDWRSGGAPPGVLWRLSGYFIPRRIPFWSARLGTSERVVPGLRPPCPSQVKDANHAEYDPYASTRFVTPLSCSLAGKEMDVELYPETVAARTYGSWAASKLYYCNFGLNPGFLPAFVDGGLVVSGVDHGRRRPRRGAARASPLRRHRLRPRTSRPPGRPHPLLSALVRVAAETHPSRRPPRCR